MVGFREARGFSMSKQTHLGAWLKNEREKKGLTQMELAHMAGTTPATISRIEDGKQGAKPQRVADIARALGIDPQAALDVLSADASVKAGIVEVERVADEDELQRALMAYTGTNPILSAARATAESVAGAIRRAGPALTGDEPEEVIIRGSRKGITVVDQ